MSRTKRTTPKALPQKKRGWCRCEWCMNRRRIGTLERLARRESVQEELSMLYVRQHEIGGPGCGA